MESIYTKTNPQTNMQANVFPNTSRSGGFNVTLKDLDSGETLPYAFVGMTEAAAKAKADSLVRI
jgi:transcription elongation GreA/GreB family factor